MKLKKFSTEIFAGIRDREYHFEDGLNILLGENEAGKSTIINAIFASLFIPPQIKLNRSQGIEFKEQYLPHPDGDYAAAELLFEENNLEYKFYKKWSNSNYQGYLELPDGVRIENSNKIAAYKKKLLTYGKSTYKNIVFSSQKNIKSVIERISAEKSPELVDTISSFLRRTVMELDGISIDKFRNKLNAELEDLTKKWDLDSMSVSNSDRGLNNPYKVGTGKIYDSFIVKEKLRREIKEGKLSEKKFAAVNEEITKLKEREENLKKDINSLAKIEADINKRESLEIEKKNLSEKIEMLLEVKLNWPQLKAELNKLKTQKNQLETEIKLLEEEKTRAKKIKNRENLKLKKKKIDKLETEIGELQQKIAVSNLNAAKVNKLETYKMKIDQTEAALKAAKLKAKINFSSADKIKIKAGVGKEKEVKTGDIVEADGYIHLKTENIDIEIESAEIDFSALENSYQQNRKEYLSLKEDLKVENLKEAREKLNKLNQIKTVLKNKKELLTDLFEEFDKEELKQKIEKFENLETARDLELIEAELEAKNIEKNKLNTASAVKKNTISEWKKRYDSFEELKQQLKEKKEKKEVLKNQLTKLSSLPAEFESAAEFTAKLKEKREKIDTINQSLREKLQQLKVLENKLPAISSPKMEAKLEKKEKEFKELIERANDLLEIKKVFQEKIKTIDQNSFNPLINSFNHNLSKLTAGKYQSGIINKDFEIALEKEINQIPANIKLLSYGTYDAVALALRFAIFDNLFEEKNAFIILDDCLVNLDPERKKEAIDLINKYKEKYQIIYTSCNPERKKDFKANIIEV